MTFAEAFQKYQADKESLVERQLAEREEALWRLFLAEHPSKIETAKRAPMLRGEFSKAIGVSQSDVANRRMLYMLGELANPLWDRIEKKQLLESTATRIIRDAKIIGVENRMSMKEAIAAALEEYDALPFSILVNGVPVRRDTTARRTPIEKKETPRPSVPPGTAKSDDYLMWQKLQQDLTAFVESKVGGVPSLTTSSIVKDFTVGVKVLIHEVQNKIKRAAELQKESQRAKRVPRHAVLSACNTLKMDRPDMNQPVNLELAKRQKKILAKLYHPDAHGGSETTRFLYEEALAAYDLLETYNSQLEPNGETNRHA